MKLITATFSILLVSMPLGMAIVCYECNSHNDSRCSDDIPPKSLQKDCSEHSEGSKYILCRKIVQNIDFEVNNNPPDVRVIRSCGWVDTTYKNRCYHRSGFGGRQEVCACDTDLCNEAAHFTTSVSMTKLLVVLGVYAVIKNIFFQL